jgi:hypothetical protein
MAQSGRKAMNDTLRTALAYGATVANAARKAGLSERTVYRRLANPAFRQQLDQLRAEMVQRTASMLTGAGMGSVKTLVDLQHDVAVSAAVRRRAARDVLEISLRFRQAIEVEQRLAALEERLKDPSPERPRN